MSDLVGNQLGQYQLLGVIGKGGSATVYRARENVSDQEVAIKVIRGELADNPEFAFRFERERRLIATLQHPNIVSLYDSGRSPGLIFLVMRYIDGGSLDDYMEGRALTLSETAHLFNQIAPALSYAHKQGVIHRDLKASNILLDRDRNAYLTDFGIAKNITGTTDHTTHNTILGTPEHMAPEQWRNEGIDGRTDIYALGIMLYTMLTGEPPFKAETMHAMMYMHLEAVPPAPRLVRPYLPQEMDAFVAKAIAKQKDNRYSSVAEMTEEFNSILHDIPGRLLQYRPPKVDEKARRKQKPRPKNSADAYSTLIMEGGSPADEGPRSLQWLSTPILIGAILLLTLVVGGVVFTLFRGNLVATTTPLAVLDTTPTPEPDTRPTVVPPTSEAATSVVNAPPTGTQPPTPTLTPTLGITVTPPPGARFTMYSLSPALISAQARYFLLDQRSQQLTTRASIELGKGFMVYVWTGTWKDEGVVTQRIVMTPMLTSNGDLSLDVYSATQNGDPIQTNDTILGADGRFRGRSLVYLLTNYQDIAAGKLVLRSSTIYINRCNFSTTGVSIERID